ncbi:hypothetical protein ID866_8818 [Astraeus odoratus]|nr:hypothetical protein ID866_8818 [Astraeus odoratus]
MTPHSSKVPTPRWMSPEIAKGECFWSVESDVWAFGMTTLELFTREVPFAKFRMEAIAEKILTRGSPDRPDDSSTCFRMTDDWWNLLQNLECIMHPNSTLPGQNTEPLSKSRDVIKESFIAGCEAPKMTLEMASDQVQEEDRTAQPQYEMGPFEDWEKVQKRKELFLSRSLREFQKPDHEAPTLGILSRTSTEQHRARPTRITTALNKLQAIKPSQTNLPMSGLSDDEVEDVTFTELTSDDVIIAYNKSARLSAILYFHCISDNGTAGTAPRSLRALEKLRGRKAKSLVVLVTTMWDKVDEESGEKKLEELKRSHWKTMIAQGAVVCKYENSPESARRLLRDLVEQNTKRNGELLQRKIAGLKTKLGETDAGQQLCSRLAELAERKLEVLTRLRKEREITSGTKTAEDLREECAELNVQLDATVGLVQALGVSQKQRRFTIFGKMFRLIPYRPLRTSSFR